MLIGVCDLSQRFLFQFILVMPSIVAHHLYLSWYRITCDAQSKWAIFDSAKCGAISLLYPGVWITFSRHSPNSNWNFRSPSQKTSGQTHRNCKWEGNKISPGWRVGLNFYSPILNSTHIWWVGESLSAPKAGNKHVLHIFMHYCSGEKMLSVHAPHKPMRLPGYGVFMKQGWSSITP
jgi:hypothetical protein